MRREQNPEHDVRQPLTNARNTQFLVGRLVETEILHGRESDFRSV